MKKKVNKAATCTGKFTFLRFGEARSIANDMNRRRDGGTAHAYRCKVCKGFHVGGSRPKPRKPEYIPDDLEVGT